MASYLWIIFGNIPTSQEKHAIPSLVWSLHSWNFSVYQRHEKKKKNIGLICEVELDFGSVNRENEFHLMLHTSDFLYSAGHMEVFVAWNCLNNCRNSRTLAKYSLLPIAIISDSSLIIIVTNKKPSTCLQITI